MINPIMKPVTRYQFCRAIDCGVKMMREMEHDINCAFHFSAEFGDVTMMRKIGGDITMGLHVCGEPIMLFDQACNSTEPWYWSKRGESQYSYWSKLEIYDIAMGLAKLAGKEVK